MAVGQQSYQQTLNQVVLSHYLLVQPLFQFAQVGRSHSVSFYSSLQEPRFWARRSWQVGKWMPVGQPAILADSA
jgi:hypothetical protein